MAHKQNVRTYRFVASQLALILTPLCGIFVWWLIADAAQPLDATDLKIGASQLHSLSAEAKKLSEAALAGRVTEDYFIIHSQMLIDKTTETRKWLQSHPSQATLESYRHSAAELSRQLDAAANQLSKALHDPGTLRSAAGDLTRIGAAAETLEHRLAHLQL